MDPCTRYTLCSITTQQGSKGSRPYSCCSYQRFHRILAFRSELFAETFVLRLDALQHLRNAEALLWVDLRNVENRRTLESENVLRIDPALASIFSTKQRNDVVQTLHL